MQKIFSYRNIFFILFYFIIFLNLTKASEIKTFLTLKSDTVNVRQGHSFDYPIKYIYKKKYLPVKVIDSWENFKKIQDYEKNNGWVYINKLSKRKAAINIKHNSIMFKKATIYSKPLAKLEKGKLVLVKKCKDLWCNIKVANYVGWIRKEFLWGRF